MLGPLFRDIAAGNSLTVSEGMAYGLMANCFITLSEDDSLRRISIYVGPQEAPAAGYAESMTVSCARQICAAISAASGAENSCCLHTGDAGAPALVLNHAGSVVTVNFPADMAADQGIVRFVTEVLPGLAPLTRPQLCILCANSCAGNTVPVRLSADTVVPMHAHCCKQVAGMTPLTPEERTVQTRAALGAACGALVGAVIWAFILCLPPLTWVAGVLMGLLPTVAYDLLKGRKGRMRMVTVLICAACAVIAGTLGGAFMNAYAAWQSEMTLMAANDIGYWAYAFAAMRLTVSGTFRILAWGLPVGLLTSALGCFSVFRKDPQETAAQAATPRKMKGHF